MKKICFSILLVAALFLAAGCSTHSRYHKSPLPSPESYNAHFGDMDADGDDLVKWSEFKDYFPQAEKRVFEALDLNGDEAVDHDEWHRFKDAHGLRHHE